MELQELKLMGHSDVSMTQNYVVCGIRQLSKEALDLLKGVKK
jgi:site-specific recombinase XerD